MIQDLDETISALLRRDLPTALAQQVQISFATPDDQFPPQSVTLPAIDLFLYDVRENLELRSNDVSIERRGDGTATRTRAPVRVDFSYLITAWPSESVPDQAEDEHRLLGEVMRVLLRYRTIPEEVLQGELQEQSAGAAGKLSAAREIAEHGRVLASGGRQAKGGPELPSHACGCRCRAGGSASRH